MFGFFKNKPNEVELQIELANVAQAEQATRALARKLLKAQEETDKVLARMAKALSNQESQIRALTEQVAESVEEINKIKEFNEFVAHTGMDESDELKKHQRQLAGLFAWKAAATADLTAIKGKL
jgi:septal ring factor EnvC (AmiA/AmiB activator)